MYAIRSYYDQVDLDAEILERRSIFAADDSRTVDGQDSRQFFHLQDAVAVNDTYPVERNIVRLVGM